MKEEEEDGLSFLSFFLSFFFFFSFFILFFLSTRFFSSLLLCVSSPHLRCPECFLWRGPWSGREEREALPALLYPAGFSSLPNISRTMAARSMPLSRRAVISLRMRSTLLA